MGRATANLAGLAALAGAAYMMNKKKGESEDTGSTRAARPESTETRGLDESELQRESNRTIGRAPERKSIPTVTPAPKPEPAPISDRDENYSNEGRRSARDSSVPPTYMTKTPGGDAKRTEGNQPMPSLRAVEARAASNKTDAMRNASRANVAAANRMKAMAANPESQAAERMYPEANFIGGPGIKTVGAAAKALANRGAGAVERSVAPSIKEIGMTQRGTAAETAAPRLGGPTPQLTGPSKAELLARDRAARAAARQESMRAENAANYGLNPEAPGYSASAGALRDRLGGADFSLGMKKGGKVKRMASGGMTSKMPSASRRGDGIASRGKTRGKIC